MLHWIKNIDPCVKVLDFFEDELGQESRLGPWLGGARLCVADVTLGKNWRSYKKFTMLNISGLYLHRLWQLGLDSVYYQG